MVDPLFQRVLVKECRHKRIPVIFDEVFTGFWRLGTEVGCPLLTFHSLFPFSFPVAFGLHKRFFFFFVFSWQTAADLLCCVPDIACFAKLMTGGIVPLAATLATDAVFTSFIGDSKVIIVLGCHHFSFLFFSMLLCKLGFHTKDNCMFRWHFGFF